MAITVKQIKMKVLGISFCIQDIFTEDEVSHICML